MLPGCAQAAPLQQLSPSKNRHPSHTICLHTKQTLRQFQPGQGLRIRPTNSQMHAQRLCNLTQTFALMGVTIAPRSTTLQFADDLVSGFRRGLAGELIPQVFNELKAFKFTKVLNRLQGGLHGQSLSGLTRQRLQLVQRLHRLARAQTIGVDGRQRCIYCGGSYYFCSRRGSKQVHLGLRRRRA